MSLPVNTDVATFDCEQQDAILAEMQSNALAAYRAAASLADRAAATQMFADAAQARCALKPFVGALRHHRRIEELNGHVAPRP